MARSTFLGACLALTLSAGAAQACLVDYKAKRDDPLRLHYGVIDLDDDECEDIPAAIGARIEADGWELLTVMGQLSADEAEEKRDDAGAYFLRY